MAESKLMCEVLVVGDSGNVKRREEDEVLSLIKNHLPDTSESVILFLGDNIYPRLKNLKGKPYFYLVTTIGTRENAVVCRTC